MSERFNPVVERALAAIGEVFGLPRQPRAEAVKGTATTALPTTATSRTAAEPESRPEEGKRTGYGLCPGENYCRGCYSIGVVDGRERFLHPPNGKPISWAALKPATEKVQ